MSLQFYTSPSGLLHDTGLGHPERAARLTTVVDALRAEYPTVPWVTTPSGTLDKAVLGLGHDPAYVDRIYGLSAPQHLDNDTVFSAGTLQAATDAVALACQAVDDLARGHIKAAFCAMRPPGHHAEYAEAMGFCVFNTAYIAARYGVEQAGFKRAVIVDFDVHHGNGTAALVARFGTVPVTYVSTHLHPHYPGTGGVENSIPHRILNVPLPFGASSAVFRHAIVDLVVPFIASQAPDLLVFSAGFDAHADDPLGGMRLTADDFDDVTIKCLKAAPIKAVLSVLEGGYDLDALESCVLAHVGALQCLPKTR